MKKVRFRRAHIVFYHCYDKKKSKMYLCSHRISLERYTNNWFPLLRNPHGRESGRGRISLNTFLPFERYTIHYLFLKVEELFIRKYLSKRMTQIGQPG